MTSKLKIPVIAIVGLLTAGLLTAGILAASPVTDTFSDSTKIASSENLEIDTVAGQVKLSGTAWTCGDALSYAGTDYTTVQISDQCWMAENLNVGTLTAGANNQGSDCPSSADVEKYCYSDNEINCTTYGGLYQWDQAMCGSTTAGAQGICPIGWHIPTHDEFTDLERAVCDSGTCATDFPYDTSTTGYRGTDEGTKLKSGGSSGFEGLLAGNRNTNGSFSNLGSSGFFWSAVQSGSNAWRRRLVSGEGRVLRSTHEELLGFSVRCLKD